MSSSSVEHLGGDINLISTLRALKSLIPTFKSLCKYTITRVLYWLCKLSLNTFPMNTFDFYFQLSAFLLKCMQIRNFFFWLNYIQQNQKLQIESSHELEFNMEWNHWFDVSQIFHQSYHKFICKHVLWWQLFPFMENRIFHHWRCKRHNKLGSTEFSKCNH